MAKVKLEIKQNKAYYSNLANAMKEDVEDYLFKAITDTEAEAIQAAPSNTSLLRGSAYKEVNGLDGVVGFKAQYAAFQEFGTGTLVNAPSEWTDYASTFKGNEFGSFEDFKDSLRDWMLRKGIDEKYLFPIMMKILKVGIEPQPFLYPAWKRNGLKFLENLEKLVKDGTK
jgi:hypothetical protein